VSIIYQALRKMDAGNRRDPTVCNSGRAPGGAASRIRFVVWGGCLAGGLCLGFVIAAAGSLGEGHQAVAPTAPAVAAPLAVQATARPVPVAAQAPEALPVTANSFEAVRFHQPPVPEAIAAAAKTPAPRPRPPATRSTPDPPASVAQKKAATPAVVTGESREPETGATAGEDLPADVRRKPHISREIIPALNMALQQRDHSRSQQLLDRLARVRGDTDPLVLKYKGLWLLYGEHYAKAGEIFEQLLRSDPGDLEAGINLAIVDLRLGHIEQARSRLQSLARHHPQHPMLLRLLDQL
jgi:tetratricopeptide (TPR) repeat protein